MSMIGLSIYGAMNLAISGAVLTEADIAMSFSGLSL